MTERFLHWLFHTQPPEVRVTPVEVLVLLLVFAVGFVLGRVTR